MKILNELSTFAKKNPVVFFFVVAAVVAAIFYAYGRKSLKMQEYTLPDNQSPTGTASYNPAPLAQRLNYEMKKAATWLTYIPFYGKALPEPFIELNSLNDSRFSLVIATWNGMYGQELGMKFQDRLQQAEPEALIDSSYANARASILQRIKYLGL